MNVLKHSFICLTLIMSGVSLLTATDDPCKDAGRDILIVESDFAPDTQFGGEEIGYTPFELLDPSSTATQQFVNGFDVQVAAQIAHRLGFKLISFNQTIFGDILTNIGTSGAINIGIAAISATKGRQDEPDISFIPYNNDSLAILLPTDRVNANPGLQDGETVLETLNALYDDDILEDNIGVLADSRQVGILADDVYSDIVTAEHTTLTSALDNITDGIFTDEAVGQQLKRLGLLSGFTLIPQVQFDSTNNDTDNVSDGLAVVVNRECCQLYADIVQAVKDMENDGTLSKLREQFNVPNAFSLDELTPSECADTQSDIDSNDISNFLFTKHCAGPLPVID